jgi:hypothetical protein
MGARAGVDRPAAPVVAPGAGSRPILLVTFDVPLLAEASALAVDAAVENGQPLVVANVIGGRYFPMPGMPVPDAIVRADVEESLREPTRLAVALGVRTERLRVLTPRPVEALVELVSERRPGLVVVGADPERMRRRLHARALRALRERTRCLVWP